MANYISWSNPVFDRTQSDIDFLTPKSRLNASDLNRIEGNIGWLASKWNVSLTTIQWVRGSLGLIPTQVNRIVNNAQKIKQAFGLQSDPFSTIFYWPDLNTIEKITYDAYQIYQKLIDWDCLETKFDTWDDLDNANISWNELEVLPCTHNLEV